MSLGVKMKGKMTIFSVCLELCPGEIAEQSSNNKLGFGGWLSFVSLSLLSHSILTISLTAYQVDSNHTLSRQNRPSLPMNRPSPFPPYSPILLSLSLFLWFSLWLLRGVFFF
jgi:hypothetical protein